MNLKTQYNQALKAFKQLAPEQEPPTLASIEAALTDKQRRQVEKYDGRLIISPAITKDFSLNNLIANYDKTHQKTWIWEPLWNQYDHTCPITAGFVLHMSDHQDAGLHFTNQSWDEEKASLRNLAKSIKGLRSISVGEWLALQTMNGKALLDKTTLTRLIHMERKTVGGDSCGPFVRVSGSRAYLDWSYGYPYGDRGVRFLVGLNLSPQPSILPSSLSLSDSALQQNTKALQELNKTLKQIFKAGKL